MTAPDFVDTFQAQSPFGLDPFQYQGCMAIASGKGVLVCAPTGAGKTVVGEFAVAYAQHLGTKCFYTTPIKALSNQKFHDLVALHGEENVGLLTGDVSINHDADIIVMTTEVLRNMIYAESSALDRLSHVVMDEIHFLSDKSRGAVWEEAILGLPEDVCLVGLSATVSNSEEFGRWLNTVRGDTEVIVSEHRPVPLHQWMLVQRKLHPLFNDPTQPEPDLNPRLLRHIQRLDGEDAESGAAIGAVSGGGFRKRSGGKGSGYQAKDYRANSRRSEHSFRPLQRPDVLKILQDHEMLPAITFIFSRAGCDAALLQCQRSSLVLTSQEEATRIAEIIDAGVAEIPDEDLKVLNFRSWRSALMRGFAAHHAGMLPAFRHIVEELFTQGLVRAVFATETLALGINMPARSVVLEKLVKFDGESHVDLTPGQYTQLTGRAGRRGIDSIGHAVVQWSPATDAEQVAGLASTRTYPLNSTFTPGYNMSVNLLKTIGFEPAHRLLEKSFAQFQANGAVVDEVRGIEHAEARQQKHYDQLLHAFDGDADALRTFIEYCSLRRELSDAEKALKKRNTQERAVEVQRVLQKLQLGDVIALPSKKQPPELAVVLRPAHRKDNPKVQVAMEYGWVGEVRATDLGVAPVLVGRVRVPRHVLANPTKHRKQFQQLLNVKGLKRPKKLRHFNKIRPTEQILQLRKEIRAHNAHLWAGREDLARIAEQYLRAQREVHRLQSAVDRTVDTLGRTFDRILELLTEMDYVEFVDGVPQITDEGERLALIHNESDLLVAQCLKRGIWDDLDPAELAGVVSMCTFENRKETRGEPAAATDPMAEAMNNTLRIWDELSVDERRHRLPISKYPESGFALAMHQWTAGAPLGYCMAAAAQSGAELTPGDFVRQCRQVVDLLEQVRSTAYNEDTKRAARRAIDAIRRGVVALGG